MLLALSGQINEIDSYAQSELGIPLYDLMQRSGNATAAVVRELCPVGSRVVILAGKGNNGGDGYAAAVSLFSDYDVAVYDVFGVGQRSECGRRFAQRYKEIGGRVTAFEENEDTIQYIQSSDCIIDAVFGTGFRGEPPDVVIALSRIINESVKPRKIAIDVPIGINADNGSVDNRCATSVEITVALSFIKPGLVSFPAKAYVGKLVYDNIGLPFDRIESRFKFFYRYLDRDEALSLVPDREENGSKGSFGRLGLITGSRKYMGAAHLTVSAALRGGAGYTCFFGESALCESLRAVFPEVLYNDTEELSSLSPDTARALVEKTGKMTAILIGSGCDSTKGLYRLVKELLLTEGCPVILDADAINALADMGEEGRAILRTRKREIILTPHPLEFARLTGMGVSDVQQHRLEASVKFAAEYSCVLVLKGAATIVTDGKEVHINSTGSSALSKAGSGDVLAGFLASLVALGADILSASALSVYIHGAAADALSSELSEFSVTPSDLPLEMGRQITRLYNA